MPRIGGSPRARTTYQPEPDAQSPFQPRDAMVVDLDDYRPRPADFELDIDGNATEVAQEAAGEPNPKFDANLALDYDDDFLNALGEELIERALEAADERQPWHDRFERGLELMGLVESDIDDGPFPGASNAVHPLLVDAVTQFWARAMNELFPPEGPAKGKVMGNQTEQQLQRAERVAEYMNHEMTVLDEGYTHEKSRLVWGLPFYGSYFTKTYRDLARNRNVTISVPAEDMIVPAEATDLATAPFYAHRMRKSPNEVKRLQIAGHYRACELELPGHEEEDTIENLKDEVQDTAPDADDHSIRHEIFEVCIDYDLEGDEHADEEGEKTGLERSYYISVDRHTRKVLSIYRGWDERDVLCQRKVYFRHWKFVPGPKFYGLGLFHLIGGLQTAATGALRVLLDSAASASLSGGFVSRHANLKGKRLILTPGVWEPVDATPEDLAKAFFSPPVKEPSAALFQLVGWLTERGEKFTATTELQTGAEDPKGAPVGTTAMMIEQGGKVMSTIHRMMFVELAAELRLRFELDREFSPADGYPYEVSDQQRTVYADDFAEGVSVVPVADPNIFSSTQRIAQAQTVLQTTMTTGVGDIKKVVRRFYKALRVPDVDDLIPPDVEPMAYDPVGEIQAMFLGKPIKVLPEQAHTMHIQVLAAFANNPQYGGNEQVMKQIGPSLLSVLGQHMAYAWATHARGLGVPVGYMDPQTGQVGGGGTPEQINAMLAQVAPALASVPGLPAIDAEGGKDGGEDDLKVKMAELQIKQVESQQKLEFEKEKHAFDMQKEQQKLEHERQMQQIKAQTTIEAAHVDQQVKQQEGQIKLQQSQQQAAIDQQQAETKAAMDQQSMAQEQHMAEQQMQHEQALGAQEMDHKQKVGDQKMAQAYQQHQQKMVQDQQKQLSAGQGQPDRLQHLRRAPEGGGV